MSAEKKKPEPAPLAVRPAQAASMIGIGRTKLYQLINTGKLTPYKLGAATLIEVAEIEAYLEEIKRGEAA